MKLKNLIATLGIVGSSIVGTGCKDVRTEDIIEDNYSQARFIEGQYELREKRREFWKAQEQEYRALPLTNVVAKNNDNVSRIISRTSSGFRDPQMKARYFKEINSEVRGIEQGWVYEGVTYLVPTGSSTNIYPGDYNLNQ